MPKRLSITTPSDLDITIVRAFDAPAQLIWDAHTNPEMIRRWLTGPPDWSMPHCTVDLRVGGRYRYVWRNDVTGAHFGSYGEFLEVVLLTRIVSTESKDGLDGRPFAVEPEWHTKSGAVNTLTLATSGSRTTLTFNMCFPTRQSRDMALKSGMSDGMGLSYDRLERVVAPSRPADEFQ